MAIVLCHTLKAMNEALKFFTTSKIMFETLNPSTSSSLTCISEEAAHKLQDQKVAWLL